MALMYNAQGQRVCAIDAATNATWYAFDEYGRLASVTNALGEVTVYEYNLQGRKTYEGGGTYPVRFTYDDEGRMTSMIMYRDESGPGDTTAWTYDLRLTLRLRHFRFHHLLLPPLFPTVSSQRLPGCVY